MSRHRRNRYQPRDMAAIQQQQHTRFHEMVSFARSHSPYYQELYRDLPEQIEDSKQLPITSKKNLMPHFDDWVTDRNVMIEKVRTFLANPNLVGEPFLNKHTVATTSGTTGNRGMFLYDDLRLRPTPSARVCSKPGSPSVITSEF